MFVSNRPGGGVGGDIDVTRFDRWEGWQTPKSLG
jgi:hypothetical protein